MNVALDFHVTRFHFFFFNVLINGFLTKLQLLVEENEELVKASVAAVRADLDKTPAWSRAPTPTDDFLLMFLRSEMFCPEKAAGRYRKFWEVSAVVRPLLIEISFADISFLRGVISTWEKTNRK